MRPDVAHNLMRLIAEGSGEDEDADMALRKYAAETYFEILEKTKLPDVLLQARPTPTHPEPRPLTRCASSPSHSAPVVQPGRRAPREPWGEGRCRVHLIA